MFSTPLLAALTLVGRHFKRRVTRDQSRISSLRRWKRRLPVDAAMELLEDRTMLSADCTVDLFAGPRLASVDSNQSEILEGVFNSLLPGSHVDLTVADWNAVAVGEIDLNGILTSLQADLGLSSPEQALSADVTLAQVFDAMADAVPADGETAALHAALLGLSQDVSVPELSGTLQLDDFLRVTLPDGSFADADLNVLNLVTASIQLYNFDNVVTTNDPVVLSGTVFNEPGVNTVELFAQVIEPPIIDPVALEGDQFYSAAMRLKMNVDLVDFTVAGTNLTIGEMQLYVDVARAQGEVTLIDAVTRAVTVNATPGVTDVYLGSIDDAVFFNRTQVITPDIVDFGTVGTFDSGLLTLSIEAKAFAEGTAPLATALEFTGPYPESQTTGTSATFVSNALHDLLTSLTVRTTLNGMVVPDPTSGLRTLVADALEEPLSAVLSNTADPALQALGTGIGEMDVTINSMNCPPVAVDDFATTPEDTPVVIDILANDTDDNGAIDPTTVTIITGPSHGTVSVDAATGEATYSPELNFNGIDTFTYTVRDEEGLESNVATVTITVTPVNDPPVAVDDAYRTDEDTPLTIAAPGVLANDSDVDGDALTAVFVAGPGNGTVTLNADGSFTYTPDADFNGVDTFTYKANDGQADSNVATVTITVNPVNDPPVAVDDAYSTDEDTPLTVAAPGVLANDSDVDGDALTVVLVTGTQHGDVTLNADGSFRYTPNANFNGTDTFTYQANDGQSDSNIATVTITVNPVNDPPVAVDDTYSTPEDTPLTVAVPGVLANDSDVDGDALTAVLVSSPGDGTLTWNGDGSFTYTPDANFNGVDTFTYLANDGTANSNVATVTITVTPVNDPPVAVDDAYSTDEDTPLTVAAPGVLANDSDVEGDALTAVLVAGPGHGTLALNADGSFSYTPDADFNGQDTFTYKANDGAADSNVATVTITVNPVNDPPLARNDAYSTDEDAPLTVFAPGVLANDSDPDGDALTAVLVTGLGHGTLALNADGSFSYTPDADFNGVDTFTYKANDGAADSNVATVTITVNPVNDPPVAVNDAYSTDEDTTLTVAAPGVLANDSDVDGDALTSILVLGPSHGTLTLSSNGSFTYTPDENFHGTDIFKYRANDGQADSNIARVTITVNAVNDPPVAVDDAYSTNEDTTLTVAAPGVLANDSDPDGDALISILVTGPGHGTLALNADGSFSYTPDANFHGNDTFTYKANDGTADSNVATVTITVNPVNDPPVAVDDAYSTNEDTALTVAAPGVLANDSDVDGDALTGVLVSDPGHGTLAFNGDGSFIYTPDANFHGTDTFKYQVNDGTAFSNVATVTITVNPVNDAPVAVDDAYSTGEDTKLTVAAPGVLANDSDPDGDALTSVLVTGPGHGTLALDGDGSFTYTPDANFNGTDTFTYKANDGQADSNVATVTINVVAANDPPAAVNDAYSTDEDTPLTVAAPGVLANDSDPDGDALTAVLVAAPGNGTLTLNADGSFTYNPDANFHGTDTFTYQANDGMANSNVATVTITVNPVNDAPVAVNDAFSTDEDTKLTVAAPGVLANDSDADGDALTAMLVAGPGHGTLTLNADGSLSYMPDTDFNGVDTFTYKANDGTTNSNVATVTITVNPANDAPVAADDAYVTDEDTTLTVAAPGVLANDSDPDGGALTSLLVTGPGHGTLALAGNGSFTYTPDANFNGTDTFTYKANDGTVDSNVATVTITVNPVNDAPVAVDDAYSTPEDTTLTVAAPGVLDNDNDPDGDALTAVLMTAPGHGTLALTADGSFSYTPDDNFNGTDTFTYKANDGTADSNVATVTITVTPVNDAPVAVDDAYSTDEDTKLTVAAPGVLANDSDPDGDSLTSVLVTGPGHGTLALNADGSFTYMPTTNFSGTDTFKYQANDGRTDSNVATVTITVNPVNDAPVAVDDSFTTDEDTKLIVAAPGVLANDNDPDGDALTSMLVTGPGHGMLTLNDDGSFSYMPDDGFHGTDTFTYKANDGTADSNVATVTITVNPVNDPPVAVDDSYTTAEDTTLTVAAPGVLANDSDPDGDDLTSVLVTGPGHGTLSLSSDGSFTYTPDDDFNGTDTFKYQANDGTADSNVATVTITVTPANDAPVANDDSFTTDEDTTLTVDAPGVLANDNDPDGDDLTAMLVTGPGDGTLTLNDDGSFSYTPDDDFHGTDTFSYKANDGAENSNVATVTITVNPINDPPVAVDDAYETFQNATLTINPPGVLANDSDPDGDALTAGLVTGPGHGTLTLNTDGSFSYTPDHNFTGTDSFNYRANDGAADSNLATVTILVQAQVADLSLTKSVDDPSPNVGGEVVFTVTVSNAGPTDATGVVVGDPLPAGVEFVSATASQGSYDAGTGVWTVGTVVDGGTASLQITAIVTTTEPTTNIAEIIASDGSDPDSTPGNGDAGEDDQDDATVDADLAAARVTHTDTTCHDFVNDGGTDLDAVQYGVRNGTISNVAPGVFFYWVEVQAPDSNFTIVIDQSVVHPGFSTEFGILSTDHVKLFNVDCTRSGLGTVSLSGGDATIDVAGATAGDVFIISVKYDSGTVVGQSEPDPSTVNYNFTTSVDGAFVSQDGTALVKKVSGGALMAGDGETSTPATAHEDLHWTEGLATGTFTVAIDVVDPAQSAQVAVAIGELNAALAPFGTALELAGPGIEADIQLRVAEETFVGGVAEGVLGFTSPAGQITIVAGWDWYLGDGGIQPGQFDFQTAVEHELVHALGGDHTDDFGSLMFPVLAPAGEIALAAPLDLSAALQAGGVGSAIGETIRAAVPPSFRLLPPQMIREHAVRWPLPLLDRRDGFGWTASILQEQPGRHDFELTMPGRSDADDHRNPLPTADDVNGGFDETPAEESLIDALFGDGFTLDALLFPASQTA